MDAPLIRHLGLVGYEETWRAMQSFTERRGPETPDELWVLEHPPVYTVGVAGRPEHFPQTNSAIPVVRVDRGGQITYHGPGQAVVYTLIDLARRSIKVRQMVSVIEQSVIDLLAIHDVEGVAKPGAPGIYIPQVGGAKIAALGLRIKKGSCFHGVSLNVDADLGPFLDIDPCGYPGLAVTRCADLGIAGDAMSLGDALARLIGEKIASQPLLNRSPIRKPVHDAPR
ncbi:MAG TPA: lipoyl(octanoyl) transferase LipB [Burkholderiales bacterium]|nr:lipoyl(octanoyl) transferase LipB [Burkholderiales bacterium]